MKIEAKNLRPLPSVSLFNRNGLNFVGSANTIQLLDTALVVEGLLKTLGLIVVDLLFRQALSEWTTVTIPYSRIVSCNYKRNNLKIIFVFLLTYFPFLLVAALPVLTDGRITESNLGIFLGLLLVLTIPACIAFAVLFFVMRLGPRVVLIFRRADGRQMQVSFRITPKSLRAKFLERLESNRKTATQALGHNSRLAEEGNHR
jgi:hypothetical protein